MQQYVLYESASGYALFEVVEAEEIGALLPQVGHPTVSLHSPRVARPDSVGFSSYTLMLCVQVQKAVVDLARFSKLVKLKGFSVGAPAWVVEVSIRWKPVSPFAVCRGVSSRSRLRRTPSTTSTMSLKVSADDSTSSTQCWVPAHVFHTVSLHPLTLVTLCADVSVCVSPCQRHCRRT